jgi:hypothetical protein
MREEGEVKVGEGEEGSEGRGKERRCHLKIEKK